MPWKHCAVRKLARTQTLLQETHQLREDHLPLLCRLMRYLVVINLVFHGIVYIII